MQITRGAGMSGQRQDRSRDEFISAGRPHFAARGLETLRKRDLGSPHAGLSEGEQVIDELTVGNRASTKVPRSSGEPT